MKLRFVAIALLALVLGACRTAPSIYQVDNASIVSNVPKPSKDDVKKAIVRAGGGLGWQFRDNGADALVGTLVLRTHTAVVDIPYSATQYSIKYKDSTNLNYDGTSIHSNYNGWIQNLHKAINVQLNTL
ncbi:MAG: hypothetical protein ACKVQQ_02820 [Burkholderiales bacterium]